MLSRIQNKFGTAGLVVAIVALVAALSGTAIAALNGGEKKEVTKIAKKWAKKFPGPTGPAGPAGAVGAPGPAGAVGPAGPAGPEGKQGIQGIQGEEGPEGEPGKDGKDGEDGVCSEANATCDMPKGSTLQGMWAFGITQKEQTAIFVDISWALKYPGGVPKFVYVNKAGEEKGPNAGAGNCPGTNTEPDAAPGYLCVYEMEALGSYDPFKFFPPIVTSGGAVFVPIPAPGTAVAGFGTWAVTAPTT